MSEDLPVHGTILSSSPCTVKEAAALLGKFLQSDSVPETGLLRGYLESVTSCLEELAARQPPKRKEKKSRKHREVDHESTHVQEHDATTSGLNAETVTLNPEAETQNGLKKGSGKTRKGHDVDGEANEQNVDRKKYSKRNDIGDAVESDENRVKKKSHKKRKEGGVDVLDNEHGVNSQSRFERNDGGVHLDNNEPGGKRKHHKKRKDRGLDVEADEPESREKKRKKRVEQ